MFYFQMFSPQLWHSIEKSMKYRRKRENRRAFLFTSTNTVEPLNFSSSETFLPQPGGYH